MKVFKLHTGCCSQYPIEKTVVEDVTGGKYPYYRINLSAAVCVDPYSSGFVNDGRTSVFAVCPICDNPIQIIGLYKKESAVKPYGKHCNTSVPDLAAHNEETYRQCPYASMNYTRTLKKSDIKRTVTDFEKNVYSLLKHNFDRCVYILNKQIDFHISNAIASEMLSSFVVSKAWLYYGMTYSNVPWMLAYFGRNASMENILVQKDSLLAKAISESSESAYLVQSSWREDYLKVVRKPNSKAELRYVFLHHDRNVVDDELIETLRLVVYDDDNKKDFADCSKVYETTLTVDQTYLTNLISKDAAFRNEKLLEIAEAYMPDIYGDTEN